MASPPKTFLITGCSSGLGYALALAALKAGHQVIATSRNPASSSPAQVREITRLGGQWATLDVASPELASQFHRIVTTLLPAPGRLDVLVNNAGVANGAVVEHLDIESARGILETNFWGPVRLTQLALPLLKKAQSGAGTARTSIVNVSSSNALFPLPLTSIYSASKAAVDAFTLALAMEVAHFGIKVLLVTPAGMRTPFLQKGGASATNDDDDDDKTTQAMVVPADYLGSPVEMLARMALDPGNYVIDPAKAAEAIVQAVDGTGAFDAAAAAAAPGEFVRLPLGARSLDAVAVRSEELQRSVAAWAGVARGVDLE